MSRVHEWSCRRKVLYLHSLIKHHETHSASTIKHTRKTCTFDKGPPWVESLTQSVCYAMLACYNLQGKRVQYACMTNLAYAITIWNMLEVSFLPETLTRDHYMGTHMDNACTYYPVQSANVRAASPSKTFR